jgi:choline dehydrogenase-like flavoprotein
VLRDFDLEPVDSSIEADLCIIGGGLAGITLAREFLGTRVRVCILESGGLDFEADTQALCDGTNVGQPYYELEESRLRFFGGTTQVWGGRCVPLDPIDFAERPWVPWSGWPITRDDLDPYYERAQRYFEIGPLVYDERIWDVINVSPPAFDPSEVRTDFWQIDEKFSRFNWSNCHDLERAPNVEIFIHANVTQIQTDPEERTVESLEVASLHGRRGRCRARRYVLAAGGIDNPRLLLASNRIRPHGLGNAHDLVGRFFMEHPHARAARVVADRPFRLLDTFRKRKTAEGLLFAPILRPAEELQKREGILNTSVSLRYQRPPGMRIDPVKSIYRSVKHRANPTSQGRRAWWLYRRANVLRHRLTDSTIRRWRLNRGTRGLFFIARAEQAPSPDSRVLLSGRRDALGMPLADLDWRIGEMDKRSIAVFVKTLDHAFRRLGLGRVDAQEWLLDESAGWPLDRSIGHHPIGGYHHMGTTRMSSDPTRGVVDADCRIHGIDNVYVAGSSVFPTAGWANPSLTIVALTYRLAAHLRGI